jgi:hypothetical protein
LLVCPLSFLVQASFFSLFSKKWKWAYEITSLSVCMSLSVCPSVCLSVCTPQITFEAIVGYSWNLIGKCCHSRWPRCSNLKSHIFNHIKMFNIARAMGRDCFIVGSVCWIIFGEFDCWVNIIFGNVWLLFYYYFWECVMGYF